MTPSNAPSLRNGTTSRVRMPPRSTAARGNGSPGCRVAISDKSRVWESAAPSTMPERISRLRVNSRREKFSERRGSALMRRSMKPLPVIDHEGAEGRLAKRMCLLEHRLKHWSEVAGRRIDDLQYLGRRGLLLQCLARFR